MNPLLAAQAELERAYAVSDAYLTIVRRVHAECGIIEGLKTRSCVWCSQYAEKPSEIPHTPDCLWVAAETALNKIGEI